MFWLPVILALLVVFYFYDRNRLQHFVRRGVKQKMAVPIFGDNFKVTLKKIAFCEMLMEVYNRFDDLRYLGVYQFYRPFLMIKDPKLIKQMCVKDFEYFLDHIRFSTEELDPLWNKNLFQLRGQRWKEMRSTLSPCFTGSKMRQIFVLIHECSKNFIQHFSNKPEEIIEMDLKDAFTRYTNDIIASTAFGIHCDSLKERENQFYLNGRRTTDFSGWLKNIKFILINLMPNISKFFFKPSFFDEDVSEFFQNIVRDSIKYREETNIERPDVLQLLMRLRKSREIEEEVENKEEGNFAAVDEHLVSNKKRLDLTLEDITAQSLLFFIAGFETVSSVLCFIAYELASNPDIQMRLMEELDELRCSKEKFSYESLAKLPYLDMVLSETMRKWPPLLVTDRSCNKPYTIQPELPGERPVQVGVGESLWIPIWPIHHDPKYWENPDKFDPERFSPLNKHKIEPYTYMPFGVGPRNCIGSRFAITEIKVVVFEILSHFEIVHTKKSRFPFVPDKQTFTLSSTDGFWFGLKKRRIE